MKIQKMLLSVVIVSAVSFFDITAMEGRYALSQPQDLFDGADTTPQSSLRRQGIYVPRYPNSISAKIRENEESLDVANEKIALQIAHTPGFEQYSVQIKRDIELRRQGVSHGQPSTLRQAPVVDKGCCLPSVFSCFRTSSQRTIPGGQRS